MESKEIILNGATLKVWENGIIERFWKKKGWRECGNNHSGIGYFRVEINNKRYFKHRIVAMAFLDLDITDTTTQIDHIDHNRSNNNLSNLRIVSHQQNNFNRSNVKGYSWVKNEKKWGSSIMLNGKTIWLGYFNIEEEAKNAYLEAKEKYHLY